MPAAPFHLDALLAAVRERSTGLGSHVHGDLHWRTVGRNGLWIADAHRGVDTTVVFLFALLHDSMRENDWIDPEHGPRAAVLARELHAEGTLAIAATQLELLTYACDEHTNGLVSDDPTVGACWDADRLDLPRVGVTPRPDLFSTTVARERPAPPEPPPSWPELAYRI
jgi:uncharacterized protein